METRKCVDAQLERREYMNTEPNLDNRPNFKNSLLYTIHRLSFKEKLLWILQIVIPITILITAILGLNDILPITITNIADLLLLTFLFILCGFKFLRERMLYAVVYFVLAALLCSILIASFFIYH